MADSDRDPAAATARDNLSGPLRDAHAVETTTGAYDPDPRTPPRQRFRAGAGSPNAARVRLSGPASLHFGRVILGRDSVMLSRHATAARPHRETAAFSIGSRLARLDGGLANQLLHALTGAKVQLSAADYRSLAEARISLPDALDALATEADLRVGDYARLADAERARPVLPLAREHGRGHATAARTRRVSIASSANSASSTTLKLKQVLPCRRLISASDSPSVSAGAS